MFLTAANTYIGFFVQLLKTMKSSLSLFISFDSLLLLGLSRMLGNDRFKTGNISAIAISLLCIVRLEELYIF